MKKRRTMIEVPGNKSKMLEKARDFKADVLVLDVEDSVPRTTAGKSDARALIGKFLEGPPPLAGEIAVRINAAESEWFFDDIHWLVGKNPATVILPKVRSCREYIFIEELLDRIGIAPSIGTMIVVETPGSLVELNEIARSSRRLTGFVAGGFDYSIEVGSTALNPMCGLGGEMIQTHLALLRQTIVAVARLHGLNAIDGPLLARAKDDAALRAAVLAARANGFDGCMVFYPPMLDTVHELFSPTDEELHWARRINEASAAAAAEGRAAFQLDGMVILPHHVTMANRMLASR